LVRLQFEEIHRWSAERGEPVQGITGIPFYYRLFGYEMGLEMDGGRMGYEAHLPKLKEGEPEPFTLRPASEADLPFLMEVYAHACARQLITCVRDETVWRYDLTGMSEKNIDRLEFRIIQHFEGEPVGYVAHPWYNWNWGLVARHYELKDNVSWLEVTPSVARYLWQTGETFSKRDGKPQVRTASGFWFVTRMPGTFASPICLFSYASSLPRWNVISPGRPLSATLAKPRSVSIALGCYWALSKAGWSPLNPGCPVVMSGVTRPFPISRSCNWSSATALSRNSNSPTLTAGTRTTRRACC
jgi:hypothetical protein